jgi:hypothetical protein
MGTPNEAYGFGGNNPLMVFLGHEFLPKVAETGVLISETMVKNGVDRDRNNPETAGQD